MVRVRFAPSPTGYLHVGSARTALFNWLFARHQNGEFILRIEDTDKERSKDEFLDEIIDSLKWLGLDWDGEVYFQSKRGEIYHKYANQLLKKGLAYREGEAIILAVPEGKISFDDLVHGKIEVDHTEIKPQVLIKSDQNAAYNFACVVDDYEMKISHVLRGDDHISNTPKQLIIYKALGFEPPKFAHIPLILGKDKSRLSKRHGATAIAEYKAQGLLPQALVNFISLLGWSPGNNREILTQEELIKEFSLDKINPTQGVFDVEKLEWMNGEYINNMTDEEFLALILPGLKKRNWIDEATDKAWLLKVCHVYKERCRTIEDFYVWADYVFKDEIEYDPKAIEKRLKKIDGSVVLEKIYQALSGLSDFSAEAIEASCRKLADSMELKPAVIIHATRVAVSGRMMGPSLFELLELLGKEKVTKRLEAAGKLV